MVNKIDEGTMREIERKALAGIAMSAPTPEKQAVYDNFQRSAQGTPQSQSASQYSPESIMQRQQDMGGQMSAIEEMLRKMADSSFQSQDAMLQQTRDQELSALQKALNDAVAQGEISVREAEAQFASNKAEIDKRAYVDAEATQLVSQDRGIQNSAQMLGLMQGDNARKTSLINQNMTDRDMRVSDIRDRLNAVKNNVAIDMAGANSKYGYASSSARGQADAQLNQSLAQMHMSDYEMNRQQAFSLDQMGLQQRHQLELMAEQFGLDLKRMDAEQIHVLARMAEEFAHQSSENAKNRSHDASMQSRREAHDKAMLTAKQKQDVDNYELMLSRELAGYTPGTNEYTLRQRQIESSMDAVYFESHAKMISDVMGKSFAEHIGNAPKHPGDKASNAQLEKYNQQVNAWNSTLDAYMSDPTNLQTFLSKIPNAPYSDKQKTALTASFSHINSTSGTAGNLSRATSSAGNILGNMGKAYDFYTRNK